MPNSVGVSHIAYCYERLGELIFIYKRLKESGHPPPQWCVNHGNSTSFYYTDPDGNEVETMMDNFDLVAVREVETMMDNFSTIDTQEYKRIYQFTEAFGETPEADFDPDKMVALYESGVPDTVLLDREEVRRMRLEGTL